MRRSRAPAEMVLDLLSSGKKMKEIADVVHLERSSVSSVLKFERRRRGARTNMQLAMHLTKKLTGEK